MDRLKLTNTMFDVYCSMCKVCVAAGSCSTKHICTSCSYIVFLHLQVCHHVLPGHNLYKSKVDRLATKDVSVRKSYDLLQLLSAIMILHISKTVSNVRCCPWYCLQHLSAPHILYAFDLYCFVPVLGRT